jgi:AAA family ATP:ADP antiporter
MENKEEFGKIRSIMFPIHTRELRKFLPLSLIFFFISFNYSALRNLKDMFILENAVAESIYYLKLIGVTPAVILFTIVYSNLSNSFGRDGRFNIIIVYFLVFYGIFLFFLLPNSESLKINGWADSLNADFPDFVGLWEALRNWHFAFFYVHSELWGTFCLSVLFWTFANEIVSVTQSKRFYSFLAIGANIALISAGSLLKLFKRDFRSMLIMVLILGLVLLVVYNLFSRDIANNPELYQIQVKKKKKKHKMSFVESFKFLLNSSYLAYISLLVISYGMVISLFESVWKSQIKELFNQTGGDRGLLGDIYSQQSIFTGITTVCLIVFLSAPIMNKGWKFAASVTPICAAIGSVLFFTFISFGEQFEGVADYFNSTPLFMGVMFGLINVMFIKSAKYTLFDPTKEITYIPLDDNSKVIGKAAVDGVGARLGKSLGSLILTTWLVPFVGDGQIQNVKQYILVMLAIIIVIWLISVNRLNTMFMELTAKQAQEKQK